MSPEGSSVLMYSLVQWQFKRLREQGRIVQDKR